MAPDPVTLTVQGLDQTSSLLVLDGTATLTGHEVQAGMVTVGFEARDEAGNTASLQGRFYVLGDDDGIPPTLRVTRIDNQSFSPALNPYSHEPNQSVRILGDLDLPATITLRVLSGTGRVVRTVMLPLRLPGEVEGMMWDGRDDQGRLVISGIYTLEIIATNAFGTPASPVVAEAEVFY